MFTKNLAKLIDVKTLITLPIVFALIYGFVMKMIDPKDFMMIVLLVVGFFFQKEAKTPQVPTDDTKV